MAAPKKASARRIGTEQSATRAALLDATEQIMVEEGYAAVSTRRVASKVGLTPALVHYYFPTTDDLLLAAYRRSRERYDERLRETLASDRPLHALWALSTDPARTALGAEFMAMANHRKAIRTELAQHIEHTRRLQAEILPELLADADVDWDICPPACLAMLMAGMSRAFVMEQVLGVSSGHDETRAFVEWWIDRLESRRKGKDAGKAPPTR